MGKNRRGKTHGGIRHDQISSVTKIKTISLMSLNSKYRKFPLIGRHLY